MYRQPVFFMILMLFLVSISSRTLRVQSVEANGTIYIRADGSVDPPTAPISTIDNLTYILTGNIASDADGIVVERDNIVFDGSDFAVECTGAGYYSGIYLDGRSNVIIQNTSVKNFYIGIWLNSSSNNSLRRNTISGTTSEDSYYGIWFDSSSNHNSISGNTIEDFYFGIRLDSSSDSSVSGNTITGNSNIDNGIWLDYSSNSSISGNNITDNSCGIELYYSSNNSMSGNNVANNGDVGVKLDYSSNNNVSGNMFTDGGLYVWYSYMNSVENNTVNGKPLVYLEGVADYSVGDAGQVVLVRCNRIRVESLNLSRTYVGVEFLETNNSVVSRNNITATSWIGIGLYSSINNSIGGNTLTDSYVGISLDSSSNNSIAGNELLNNSNWGIMFSSSSNHNSIGGNNMTNNYAGIYILDNSSDNFISDNNIANNNGFGIELDYSYNSSISGNNITNNSNQGISLYSCSNNSIIGNNVTDDGSGIILDYSSNNSVSGNDIAANIYYGINLYSSSDNIVYNNDFVNNAQQVGSVDSRNAWDDGYPSGGNYWSDYAGLDLDQDGIGDIAHVLDANNTDNYPLMGMYSEFNVAYFTPPLVSHACNVTVISNSSVSDFVTPLWIEHPEVLVLEFNVTGQEGSTGFCRVSFPTAMTNSPYHVFVSGIEVPYVLLPCSNADYSYLYFTYTHSTKEVLIIPEFPSLLILPVFFITTLLAVKIYRRNRR